MTLIIVPIESRIFIEEGELRFIVVSRVILVLLILLTMAIPRGATVGTDFSRCPHWVGGIQLSDDINGIALIGDLAYFACSDGYLYTVYVSDPTQPTSIHTEALPVGDERLVGSWGNLIYLSGDSNFLTYDVSGTGLPQLVNTHATLYRIIDMAFDANLVVMARSLDFGLVIAELTNPINPTVISETEQDVEHVAVSGELSFTWTYCAAVRAYDISDPANPAFLSTFEGPYCSIGSSDYLRYCNDVATYAGRVFTIFNDFVWYNGDDYPRRKTYIKEWDLSVPNVPVQRALRS